MNSKLVITAFGILGETSLKVAKRHRSSRAYPCSSLNLQKKEKKAGLMVLVVRRRWSSTSLQF